MGDIDILVKRTEIGSVMKTLADLGYEMDDQHWLRYCQHGHHHLPGARHPNSGVTVEVHTGLMSSSGPFAGEPVFHSDNVEAQRDLFDRKGILAARFTPEFQLVYTIAHWAADGNWAVNLTSINDAVHILRRH